MECASCDRTIAELYCANCSRELVQHAVLVGDAIESLTKVMTELASAIRKAERNSELLLEELRQRRNG